MVPKKAKEFIPEVAKDLGISEDLVRDLTTFYWKTLRKRLSSLESSAILVTGIGTFKIKFWKLPELKLKLESKITYIKPDSFRKFETKVQLEEELAKVEKLITIFDKEKIDKEAFKKYRHEYILKRDNPNMAEPQADNSGDKEQFMEKREN